MASCKYVLTLIKEDDEDDYLRELWRSLTVLRGSYLYHANKLRRKHKVKRVRRGQNSRVNKPTVEAEGSGASKKGNDQGSIPGLGPFITLQSSSSSQPSAVTNQTAPVKSSVKESPVQVPIDPPPLPKTDSRTVVSSSVSVSKPWVDIVSPPKLVPPLLPPLKPVVSEKETKEARPQPVNKTTEKAEPQGPPKILDLTVSEREVKVPKVPPPTTLRHPGVATTTSLDLPVQVESSSESVGRYKQWLREFSRQDIDVSQVKKLDLTDKTKIKLYCVWDGKQRGIYRDWDSCQLQVKGYKYANYRKLEGTLVEILTMYREKLMSYLGHAKS